MYMRFFCKVGITISFAAIALCGAFAQEGVAHANSEQPKRNAAIVQVADKKQPAKNRRLTKNDRKALVALVLSKRVQGEDESDCSHLVHTIYESAGFPYAYAPSDDLYSGVAGFQRVKAPRPGDLVVWRGHVGIVIKPSKHTFFSSLRSGLDTDNYNSAYWKRRGQPRFYRYVKKASMRTVK
jgi:cell wall-associated NlpC family hydrolase